MLINDDRTVLKPLVAEPLPDEPIEQDDGFTFREKLGAAFQLENEVGAYYSNNVQQSVYDKAFIPFDSFTDIEKIDQDFIEDAKFANSDADLDSIRKQRNQEDENIQKLTGLDGAAAILGAAVFSPINLIPIGGALSKAYSTGSFLKGAVITAGVTAGAVTAQEALLHSQQLQRTYGESAINITAGAFLGGVLGGFVTKLKAGQLEALSREVENIVPENSVGAMEAGTYKIRGAVANFLVRASKIDPVSRTMTQPSLAARKLTSEAFELAIDIDGLAAPAAESLAKSTRDTYIFRGVKENDSAYRSYLNHVGVGRLKAAFTGEALSRKQFNELVSKQIRNPSADADPFVKQAADAWVKNVYDPIKKDLIDLGMLDPNVKVETAAGYLNRVWSKEKIAANYSKFNKVVTNWLIDNGVPEEATGLGDDAVKPAWMIADEVSGTLMGSGNSMLPLDFKLPLGDKGPLKARTFNIPDELIEEFLENDIEKVAARYVKQLTPDIELIRKFGDGETPTSKVLEFESQINDIRSDYRVLIDEAKTPKQAEKLRKQMEGTIKDIQGMRDRMRGTYGQPDFNSGTHRTLSAARNLNFLRLMGGVTVSSFPDVARLVMAEGLGKAFGGSFRHLSRALSGNNLAADDVRWWGIGTDAYTGGRLEAISDINDYVLGNTGVEKALQFGADTYGNINLMNRWTGGMKTIHAVSMQTEVMSSLSKGLVDPRLERLGISPQDARAIHDQVKKHGFKEGNAWVYKAQKWDDQGLAMKWYAAMKKESDRVIVVPGQEKPLFMSTELGKTVMQFRSFMLSATQRVMIAGVQGQDAHMLQGSLAMVSMGAMTYVIKNTEAGREIDYSPQAMITEGIDRSGALGLFMEINNTLEKTSKGNLGLRPMLGVDTPSSRYASRTILESFGGPTIGSLASTSLQIASSLTDGEGLGKADLRAIRRIGPYQNLTGFRRGADVVEEKLADLFNLE